VTVIVYSRIGERAAKGHATREQVPPSGHADWVRSAIFLATTPQLAAKLSGLCRRRGRRDQRNRHDRILRE
jgi:hypothetical protein